MKKIKIALLLIVYIGLCWLAASCSNDQNINEVKETEKYLVVDFYGDGCKACRKIQPIIKYIDWKYPEITVLEVDVNKDKTVLYDYMIVFIPTVILFENGEEVKRIIGYHEDSTYINAVEKLLE